MTTAKLESRRTVHKGRIFSVDVDRVQLPSGFTSDMDIVRHPGSVVLLPMPSANEIILIKQYRYSIDRWIWELPAGTLQPAENPAGGAARECEEEIGLVPHRVEQLGAFYPTPGFCDEVMNFFRCSDLRAPASDSTVRKDEDEDLEPRTFTLEEARALIQSGQIVDLKTVAGLALLSSNVA
ncbi:MAG TPA: NUDIX hydrolase [Vicinamibacterales bacterium]|nr:NUDIX hydrolase [Vicinamibacterales bacterium]